MKQIYAAAKMSVFTLCMMCLLPSCFTENTDDCPDEPTVRIAVTTLAEATKTENGSYEIDDVHIYIFDQYHRYIGVWEEGVYTKGEAPYEAYVNLTPGIYHFVAWTNQSGIYTKTKSSFEPEDPAEELVIALQTPSDGQITDDISDLHHGIFTGAEVLPNTDHTFEIIIRPDTYRINFVVEGLEAYHDHLYLFSITDNNTHYSFDNSILVGMDDIRYVRTRGFTDGELTASLKTLRLTADREPLFELSDTTAGEVLHTGDLVEMILTAYESIGHTVDFETEFEFDLRLIFDADMGLTVTVDSWNYNPDPTPLG